MENNSIALKKHAPILSIVCCTFNHEKFIKNAIDGFLLQKADFPFEVVIHDDASSDNTQQIIESYYLKYPEIIKPVFQKSNQFSLGKKIFPIALQFCLGKYIAICEGDDFWIASDKIQKQVDFLEKNLSASFTAHSVEILDDTQKFNIYDPFENHPIGYFETGDILQKHFIPTLSIVFRRDALVLPEWYYNCRSGDIAIELILSLYGPGYFFPEKMGCYRHHDGGITKCLVNHSKIYKQNYRLYKNFNILSEGKFEKEINKKLAFYDLEFGIFKFKHGKFFEAISQVLKAWKNSPFYTFFGMLIPILRGRIIAWLRLMQ